MDTRELIKNYKKFIGKEIVLEGWIRNHRKQKDFGFLDFSDGTCFDKVQLVYNNKTKNFDNISKLHIGSAIRVVGNVIESLGSGQEFEVEVKEVKLIGDCPEDYLLQPKRHSMEFLRSIAHLRPRSNLFNAVFRVRSVASYAIHDYFYKNNYVYVHTPLLTTADCEGSDQMFKVTTFDFDNLPKIDGKVDFTKELFGKQTFITGSGQLHGETFAMAYKKIYTFGPTFRTENSNTKTHANEFWMIEPEIAFCDLDALMDMEEDFLKYIIKFVLDECPEEIKFLDSFVEKGLKEKLEKIVNSKFARINHKEAIDLLLSSNEKWEFIPSYEGDIAKEHEKWLAEYFNGPIFIKNWPKDIKAYYMKLNDDGKTVAAVDLQVPGAGELMGGSQREDDYDKLIKRMKELGVDSSELEWYLDLRRYGGCPHSGFGMGFERLIMYLTGVENIRDVIPYPRTPNNCLY